MPDQTRTLMISSSAYESLEYDIVIVGVVIVAGTVSVHTMWSVWKNSDNVSRWLPLSPRWPDGWSGYGGFAIHESQAGSAAVAGLPSVAASRIAVIGLQKP